jgi:hypothetical protein
MKWFRFFRRRQADADLLQEIGLYLDEEIAENMACGMSKDEARRQARIKFGNPQCVRESLWQQNTIRVVDDLWRDLKFAARALVRAPGFAMTAILTLALGLGANTAIFSLMNALLLRPLPVPHAEQLAMLQWSWSQEMDPRYGFSAPMFCALENGTKLSSQLPASTVMCSRCTANRRKWMCLARWSAASSSRLWKHHLC